MGICLSEVSGYSPGRAPSELRSQDKLKHVLTTAAVVV